MESLTRPIADSTDPARHGATFELRWTANKPPPVHSQLACVISITPVDGHRAMFEAWCREDDRDRELIKRRLVACETTVDGDLLHVEAALDERRILVATLRGDDRLLYARTPLLADAGVAPGACDPPSCRVLSSASDAASA